MYCTANKSEYFQITVPKCTRLMSQASIIKRLGFRPNSVFFLVISWCELARDHALKLGPEVL